MFTPVKGSNLLLLFYTNTLMAFLFDLYQAPEQIPLIVNGMYIRRFCDLYQLFKYCLGINFVYINHLMMDLLTLCID